MDAYVARKAKSAISRIMQTSAGPAFLILYSIICSYCLIKIYPTATRAMPKMTLVAT